MERQTPGIFVLFPVFFVSNDRVADIGQMHPYLVLSAGQQRNFKQGVPFRSFKTW